MTKKLIYLEDALDALAEQLYHNEDDYRTAVKAIGGLPSAQPERKNGKWIKISRSWLHDDVQCSECGNMLDMNGVNAGRGDAHFCPNCGADMRGKEV